MRFSILPANSSVLSLTICASMVVLAMEELLPYSFKFHRMTCGYFQLPLLLCVFKKGHWLSKTQLQHTAACTTVVAPTVDLDFHQSFDTKPPLQNRFGSSPFFRLNIHKFNKEL